MAINNNYKDSTPLKSNRLSFLSLPSIFTRYPLLLTLIGPIISGFFVFVILSIFDTPLRITVPLTVVVSIIMVGLSTYYGGGLNLQYRTKRRQTNSNKFTSTILFIAIYITSVVLAFLSYDNPQFFVQWQKIAPLDIVKLGFAIGICIFLPGYALISIIFNKKSDFEFLPKFLLSYILSMLITGLATYIIASIGLGVSNVNYVLGGINLGILCLFIYIKILNRDSLRLLGHLNFPNPFFFWESSREKIPQILVFTGLFALVVISTYYLYSGTIIGDQWFHHRKALIIQTDKYRDFSLSGLDPSYPPLFSSFLAGFFDLSGVPTINSYASIHFLNFIPIIAFYYFFVRWIRIKKNVALLATTLFTLSSGFGWIYALNMAVTHDSTDLTPGAALDIYHLATIKTFDISVPNSFINVAHPDSTTSLIVMALPAGFVLLAIIREKMSDIRYISMITMLILVYLFHPEFGLFVLVAVILVLIFDRERVNYFFIGLLIGFSIVSIVALTSPDDVYIGEHILVIPIIAMFFLLIISIWALTLILTKVVPRLSLPRWRLPSMPKRINKGLIRFILGVTLVSVVSYLYILSFIIWDNQLPLFDIRIHTTEFQVVPWHFYPLRFGVVGLLALACLLSYIFKRFEKEVFVFGILAIIAFLAGPYYDEQRFNKYVMVGMVGFASLFIYKILFAIRQSWRPVSSGIIISILVTSSSLSILMYISYTALALENRNSDFNNMLARRSFPLGFLHLVDFLRANINPRVDNIAIPENQLETDTGGIFSQILDSVGIPIGKLVMSRSTLQESTLEGLYDLLHYSNARFIVLQKQYLSSTGISDVLKFALDNFEIPYEDKNRVVLSIPHLSPTSDKGDIALISPGSLHNYSIPFLSTNRTLDYNKDFTALNSSLEKEGIVTISGNTVHWSNVSQDKLNYIEGRFRVTGDNKTDNHGGIVWSYGDKIYHAFIRPDRGFFVDPPRREELRSESTFGEAAGWYTLKIVDLMNGKINIFLNDVLEARVHKPYANSSISNVGIYTMNSTAEFEPLLIGTVRSASEPDIINQQNEYYYALTSLALSNVKYNTFVESDFSAFSKKNIMLPFDPVDPRLYLELAKKGKTIIVLNSNKDFSGGFSKYLCIKPASEKFFDSIKNSVGRSIQVFGTARDINTQCPGAITKSSYMRSGQEAAPFAIEREYGNGKIIFVNILPYLAAITTDKQFFSTLNDIMSIINLNDQQNLKDIYPPATTPATRFVGGLQIYGLIDINSSSFLPTDDFYTETISLRKQKQNDNQALSYQSTPLSNQSKYNMHIKNLTIYGAYNASVNLGELSYLPYLSKSFSIPPFGYIQFDLPTGSNITIELGNNGSMAEFFIGDEKKPMNVTSGDIEFKNINRGNMSLNSTAFTYPHDDFYPTYNNVSVLMKSPVVKVVDGIIRFQELHSNNPYTPVDPWISGVPLQINGNTTIKLNHTNKDLDSVGRLLTYFKWIEVHTDTDMVLKKQIGSPLKIQWDEIITSDANAKLVIVMTVLTVLTIYVIWSNRSLKRALIEHKRSPV